MAIWDKMEPGDSLSDHFLLREYQVGVGKNGKKYLTLTLGTREGDIEGKLWDGVEGLEGELARNTPVRVDGVLSTYRDKLQLTVRTLYKVAWNDELFTKLVPASRFGRAEMEAGVRSRLGTLEGPWARKLAEVLLASQQVSEVFFQAPAAKGMHHAYVRGLAEHTLSMMGVADSLWRHYDRQFPGLMSRDELLLGVFLHDLGKTVEYSYLEGIDITTRGRLVGHLAIGLMALNDAVAGLPGFPEELADRLRHLILAHHGEPEKGSPVWPVTMEALLLHHIDHLDAEMNAVGTLITQAGQEEMSPFNTKFGRRFLNPLARKTTVPGLPEPTVTLPDEPVAQLPTHSHEESVPAGARPSVASAVTPECEAISPERVELDGTRSKGRTAKRGSPGPSLF